MTVEQFLKAIGLEQYWSRFQEHGFDNVALDLPKLTDEDLRRVGIPIMGHRLRILRQIAEWNRPNLCKDLFVSHENTCLILLNLLEDPLYKAEVTQFLSSENGDPFREDIVRLQSLQPRPVFEFKPGNYKIARQQQTTRTAQEQSV